MNAKKIFITGASGCIGHYMAETLIQETNHELYLLVRNPEKLKFDWKARPGIHILQGDMRDIEQFAELLQTINVAIVAATAWGGTQEVFDVNVTKTLRLIQLLSPQTCQQVIYFSTASILGRDNNLLKEAGELGTDYISSKYNCMVHLSALTNVPPITALYPTLVLGGDAEKPVSHLSSGLPLVAKWIGLIRWFKADGSFHFIHGADIAKVVNYLVEHPPASEEPRHFVLGNSAITANEVVEQACQYLNKNIFFRITLSPWLADFFIWLFRIQVAAWDRFCISYRHFTYQNLVNPESIGMPSYCGTVADMLRTSGIPGKDSK
ncbi:NAD(P)-dependent oxidoreductase [Microcoleus sp. F10-C6]|uniref:NAD(P)-dependent oxidoreductase n=1 Tax=unclassified Microcoleus TaxID=2642155 RepID=UPI002FD2F77B